MLLILADCCGLILFVNCRLIVLMFVYRQIVINKQIVVG